MTHGHNRNGIHEFQPELNEPILRALIQGPHAKGILTYTVQQLGLITKALALNLQNIKRKIGHHANSPNGCRRACAPATPTEQHHRVGFSYSTPFQMNKVEMHWCMEQFLSYSLHYIL